MKEVKISRNPITGDERVIEVPEGCFKELTYDYQDSKPYYKYFYISKKGKKKECKIKYV